MKKINFTKMQGVGNDFIILNEDELEQKKIELDKDFIKKICNRNFGIGANALLIVNKGKKTDFKYIIYKADGLKAEISGNGIICYMKYLFDKGDLNKSDVSIATGIGDLNLSIDNNIVTVDIGAPSKIKKLLYHTKKLGDRFPIKAENAEFIFTPISIGNPHAVIFLKDIKIVGVTIKNIGLKKYAPLIENNQNIFSEKTNVEFAYIKNSREIYMRIWERGIGETLGCGTGACAAVVAGILCGRLEKNKFIKVILKGGVLDVKWSGNEKDGVIMKGKSEMISEGVYYY